MGASLTSPSTFNAHTNKNFASCGFPQTLEQGLHRVQVPLTHPRSNPYPSAHQNMHMHSRGRQPGGLEDPTANTHEKGFWCPRAPVLTARDKLLALCMW